MSPAAGTAAPRGRERAVFVHHSEACRAISGQGGFGDSFTKVGLAFAQRVLGGSLQLPCQRAGLYCSMNPRSALLLIKQTTYTAVEVWIWPQGWSGEQGFLHWEGA